MSIWINKNELTPKIIIIFLLFFSYYSTLIVGLSWDEIFHYINGKLRFEYLKTFGKFKDYNYSNNIYYPGLYVIQKPNENCFFWHT